jgi:phenylpropionate dioxygenase-like ring-hydroxylating dioxygenase large terminal subunit
MFPMNAWYVACSSDEIDDKPLGRKVCNQSIVFYRGTEGRAVALDDWCPHHKDFVSRPEEQAQNDQFLPCCSRAQSALLVLDLSLQTLR